MDISEHKLRIIFAVLLVVLVSATWLFSSNANAAYIKCWADNQLIYSGTGHAVRYDNDMIAFKDRKGYPTFVFGNCVIRTDKTDIINRKGIRYATHQVKKQESHGKKH